jgi:catechol 2,3-dioxygenase-like lactoylglutathione lyase family enzyme
VQTRIGHVLLSVKRENLAFYRELTAFLGWQPLYDDGNMLGVGSTGASLWFAVATKDAANDYDGPGMNHLGIHAETQADVDATAAYLTERGVTLLFDTPRHRAEFSRGPDQTYYQVMFESPDRILLEVVYTGPKSP